MQQVYEMSRSGSREGPRCMKCRPLAAIPCNPLPKRAIPCRPPAKTFNLMQRGVRRGQGGSVLRCPLHAGNVPEASVCGDERTGQYIRDIFRASAAQTSMFETLPGLLRHRSVHPGRFQEPNLADQYIRDISDLLRARKRPRCTGLSSGHRISVPDVLVCFLGMEFLSQRHWFARLSAKACDFMRRMHEMPRFGSFECLRCMRCRPLAAISYNCPPKRAISYNGCTGCHVLAALAARRPRARAFPHAREGPRAHRRVHGPSRKSISAAHVRRQSPLRDLSPTAVRG